MCVEDTGRHVGGNYWVDRGGGAPVGFFCVWWWLEGELAAGGRDRGARRLLCGCVVDTRAEEVMKKAIMASVLAFALVSGVGARGMDALTNWNGYDDTVSIVGVDSGSTKYSRALGLSGYEDIRAVIMVDDTSIAGLGADSIVIQWGYQTMCLSMDSIAINDGIINDTTIDTVWDDRITIDTVDVDSFGVSNVGSLAYDGTLTRTWGGVDTANVSGYAYQSRWFVPEWDVGLRYWATGLLGTSSGDSLVIIIDTKRRLHSKVR